MLTASGRVFCCGRNQLNQCGLEGDAVIQSPTKIMENIRDIATGNAHNLCLSTEGELFVFGDHQYDQLGVINESQHLALTKCTYFIEKGISLKKLAVGGWHNIVTDEEGVLWGFGWNTNNQLGLEQDHSGQCSQVAVPRKVVIGSGDEGIETVSCGSWHSVVLTQSNKVYTFGYNGHGECSVDAKTKNAFSDSVETPRHLTRTELSLQADCRISRIIAE